MELTTPADTLLAISMLPVLRASTDSAIRSCREFQISCSDFRRVADSLLLVKDAEIATVTQLYATEHPSGLKRLWDRVKLPLGFVGGIVIGRRVTR